MKIIFLEPINVLSSRKYRKKLLEINNYHNYDNYIDREFEPEKVQLFKKILDATQAKMVLYTKDRCCSQKIGSIMHKLIKMGISDSSWFDTIPSGGEANQALQKWITDKSYIKIENYVVLDSLRNGQTSENTKNLFWADESEGLTEEISNKIIDFLNK